MSGSFAQLPQQFHADIAQLAVHGSPRSAGVGSNPAVRSIPPDNELPVKFWRLPMTVEEAREKGRSYYWPELGCDKDHPMSPYYTKNQKCVMCARAATAERERRINGHSPRQAPIAKAHEVRPFVHILPDWSPVMVNVRAMLAVRA